MYDLTMFMYIFLAIIASIGSVLFIWWLYKNKFHASAAYMYVTIMIVGEAIRSWINIKGRALSLADDGSFLSFTLGWLWSARTLVSLVGLTAIVLHMAFRMIKNKDPNIMEYWGDKLTKFFALFKW